MTDYEYAADVARVLRGSYMRASNEAALQRSIELVLQRGRIAYQREKALGPGDRPDFLLRDGRIVLEAKARYNKKAIYRQIVRYAEHDQVTAILLVTGTATGMPATIEGKPVIVIPLGLGALGC